MHKWTSALNDLYLHSSHRHGRRYWSQCIRGSTIQVGTLLVNKYVDLSVLVERKGCLDNSLMVLQGRNACLDQDGFASSGLDLLNHFLPICGALCGCMVDQNVRASFAQFDRDAGSNTSMCLLSDLVAKFPLPFQGTNLDEPVTIAVLPARFLGKSEWAEVPLWVPLVWRTGSVCGTGIVANCC